jgi:hypothetical protein
LSQPIAFTASTQKAQRESRNAEVEWFMELRCGSGSFSALSEERLLVFGWNTPGYCYFKI